MNACSCTAARNCSVPPQLPEEEFWEKYNERLEFPLSTVGAVFLHVMVGVVLFLVLNYLVGSTTDKSTVPITFVDIGGNDDFGQGSEGSGGDEIVGISGDPLQGQFDTRPTPDLQNPQVNAPTVNLNDPTANAALNPNSAFSTTDAALKNKQNGSQSKDGFGNRGGQGGEGNRGAGPGGSGNDATWARQQNWSRWVISFSTFENDGRDYLNQLGAFGATLVIPRPGGEYLVYDDILHHTNYKSMSKADAEKAYQSFLWFSEDPNKSSDPGRRARSNRTIGDVARALRLDFTPDKFWAVFPREVDGMLAAKESAMIDRIRSETIYRNLTVDDVQTTVFAVDRQSGGKQVEVIRMQLKDGTPIIVQNNRIIIRPR